MNLKAFAVAAALGVGAVLSGCATPGQVVKEERSPVCPSCSEQTRTTAFEGLTFDHHVCPKCETKYVDDGDTGEGRVHYCSKCRLIVQECPQCAAQ